jgi:peptide/nickel transport system substrate-binding protein
MPSYPLHSLAWHHRPFTHLIAFVVVSLLLFVSPLPSRAQTTTLRIADSIDMTNADPQVSNEIPVLYTFAEGLTSLSDTGEIMPFLAEGWDVNDDATEFTFYIRPDVRFHNGRMLTGDDVLWSLQRIQNPDTGAFRGNNFQGLTLELVDDMTLRVTSPTPNAVIPAYMTDAFILAPESIGQDGTINQPIGTGPFTFQEWMPGQELRLAKFIEYWRGEPLVDEISYLIIPDPSARLNALRSNSADIIASIRPTDLPLLAGEQDIVTQLALPNLLTHLTFNTRDPIGPLADVRVRRAIAYMIDKESVRIAMVGEDGPGVVNNQYWNEGDFWRLPIPDEFAQPNEAIARDLLEEAGVADGFETTILTWADGRPAAEVVQARLLEFRITAQIEYAPDFPTYRTALEGYEYGMLIDTAFPRTDPATLLTFWNSTNPNNIFRGGYSNPDVDTLLAAGVATTDPEARREAYTETLTIVQYGDVASILMVTRNAVWGMRNTVEGFTPGTGQLNRIDGGVSITSLVTP